MVNVITISTCGDSAGSSRGTAGDYGTTCLHTGDRGSNGCRILSSKHTRRERGNNNAHPNTG